MNEELDRLSERIEITDAGLKVLREHLDRIDKLIAEEERKLSDPYVDGFNDGVEAERERIRKILTERAEDLEACHKSDDCWARAEATRVNIADIEDSDE